MTRISRLASALLLATFAMAASIAHAETTAKTGNVEVVTGWYWPENGSLSTDPDSDFTAGLRFGYNFTNRFGIQGNAQWLATSFERSAPFAGSSGDVTATIVDLSLIWNANPDDRAVFHVFGGPGYAWTNIDLTPAVEDDDDVFTLHLGLGASIYATKHFYIRPDVAVRWFSEDEGSTPTVDGDGHTDFQFTVGLGWEWGGN